MRRFLSVLMVAMAFGVVFAQEPEPAPDPNAQPPAGNPPAASPNDPNTPNDPNAPGDPNAPIAPGSPEAGAQDPNAPPPAEPGEEPPAAQPEPPPAPPPVPPAPPVASVTPMSLGDFAMKVAAGLKLQPPAGGFTRESAAWVLTLKGIKLRAELAAPVTEADAVTVLTGLGYRIRTTTPSRVMTNDRLEQVLATFITFVPPGRS